MASGGQFAVSPDKCERDIILFSDKADLSDPALAEAIKRYVYNKSTR